MHEVLVNRLGGLSLPRKSVVRLTDRPDMTVDVYRGRKTTIQSKYRELHDFFFFFFFLLIFLFIYFFMFFVCHYYYSANLQIQHYCLYSVSPTL